MKIALFVASLPQPNRKFGGVDATVHRLANQLTREPSDEITVFSLNPCPTDAKYRHKRLFPELKFLENSKFGRLFILPFLLNFVNFPEFDVIHLHGDDWFFFRRSIPSVRTLHGSALNEARSATSLRRKLVQYLIYPLEHLSVRLSTIALAVGSDARNLYNIPARIENGVDAELFYPGEKTSFPSILFIGTWEGRKRGEFLFQTFIDSILPEIPDAILYMVSDFCRQHPNVIEVKFPDDRELAKLYRQAWIFAYPSLYEGFGIPYIEALASGTAIVSSVNIGARDVLENGKYGILVDDDNFARSTIQLARDPDRRKQLEELGLERAKNFTWEAVASRHRKIYLESILVYKNGHRSI